MKKLIVTISAITLSIFSFGQDVPNDCSEGFDNNVCNEEPFTITSDTSTDDVVDFTAGSGSNPSTNPNGSNSGCLLSGETSSTFMLVNVISNGTLEWSIGTDGGGFDCYDWIMWPIQADGSTCAQIQGGTLPPVSCNWNGACEGFTGMADPANMPAGADASNFEAAINVLAGEQYLICLSNFSFADLQVPISFFGSASISCSAQVPDQTICLGETAEANVVLDGILNPSYTWNTTVGVMGDPAAGPNFTLNPVVTTDYEIYIAENGVPVDTTEFTITVVEPPTPDAGLDFDACFGQSASLSPTPTDPTNTFSWSFTGPVGAPGNPNVIFSPNNTTLAPNFQVTYPGAYVFTLSEDNGVCPIETDEVVGTFHQVSHTIDLVQPSCADSCNASITVNSATGVEFSIDGGTTYQASNVFNNICEGTYTVKTKDAFGCSTQSSVTLTDPLQVQVLVSNDTTVCINGTASLIASAMNGATFDFHWDHTIDLGAQQNVQPLNNTVYTVYAENENGCVSNPLSINVDLFPPLTLSITSNDTICPGTSSTVVIAAGGGKGAPYHYNWYQHGGADPGDVNVETFMPNVDSQFYIEVSDECETPMDTVTSSIIMSPVPVVSFTADTTEACEPGEFRLSNTTDPLLSDQLHWIISNGTELVNAQVIDIDIANPGNYDVKLIVTSDKGCVDSLEKTSYLKVYTNPIADFTTSPNFPTMFNPIAQMNNISTGGYTYEWDFGIEGTPAMSTEFEPEVTYPDATVGTYPIELIVTSDKNCKDTIVKNLDVIPELLLYVPNSFTPDGDEYNPTWGVVIDGIDVVGFELSVFNRWGEIVWRTEDPTDRWDGKFQNKLVETGTYVWTLTAKDVINDKKYAFNGHLNVLY